MLIYMVIVFGVCWLPLNFMNFLADINGGIYCWEYYNFSFFIAHVFAMSSTCYNPFLYGWYNESFQKEFVRMLPILKYICVRKENGGTNEEIWGIRSRLYISGYCGTIKGACSLGSFVQYVVGLIFFKIIQNKVLLYYVLKYISII